MQHHSATDVTVWKECRSLAYMHMNFNTMKGSEAVELNMFEISDDLAKHWSRAYQELKERPNQEARNQFHGLLELLQAWIPPEKQPAKPPT